jgi:hypothetical protein
VLCLKVTLNLRLGFEKDPMISSFGVRDLDFGARVKSCECRSRFQVLASARLTRTVTVGGHEPRTQAAAGQPECQ